MKKPNYTSEFKRSSAELVLDQGYTIREAYEVVNVSASAMCVWVKQLKEKRNGVTRKA